VVAAIANYRPTSVGSEVASFARSVVTKLSPASPSRARSLLWACARLGAFGEGIGLELTEAVLLHPSVIERFIVVATKGCSPAGRRTLRTNLRFVATTLERGNGPCPTPLPRERAAAPYRADQMEDYLALARHQPTVSRRMRAGGLLALGAGAGLTGSDLRGVRGTDVVARSGGLVVDVGGAHPRVVPVLARYHQVLSESAAFAGSGYVIGGIRPGRKNVTTPLVRSLAGGNDLPRLATARLRATWLCACAEAIGLHAFLGAAGIVCSQRLGDLAALLPAPSEAETVALLGGTPGAGGTR
jgi:integrase